MNAHAGWSSSRVLVPGSASQLGAFGLFSPPEGAATVVRAGDAQLHALEADDDVLWLTFGEVARAGADGVDWAELALRHALWVVSGVPVLAGVPGESAGALAALTEVLREHDVPLLLVAHEEPGPMPARLPVDVDSGVALPPDDFGS
ncbi:hypothetical protein SPF06_01215 [Sinomonas sp. JGH33]|uniref:PucR family transcriptional regulator n=1 Tax=Sinomonas terricola TaxID=3110330 RepID=A0ABU5T0Z7_9MICC|nr:hypothetical protein [Sinomonas sp. JGH33]MEA5453331.1 hypothetical protein [Sinomonas sp. JGH33]